MARKYGTTWAHLHLPKAKRGDAACISVKHLDQPVQYAGYLHMTGVVFCVREAGRQATVNTGVKNVHAWVTGERQDQWRTSLVSVEEYLAWGWRQVKYTPQVGYFWDVATGQPVRGAEQAVLVGTKVFAQGLY